MVCTRACNQAHQSVVGVVGIVGIIGLVRWASTQCGKVNEERYIESDKKGT